MRTQGLRLGNKIFCVLLLLAIFSLDCAWAQDALAPESLVTKSRDKERRIKKYLSVSWLILKLEFDHPWNYERTYAAEKLGEIGGARAVEPLINALYDRNDWSVRREAAKALGKIGDVRAVGPLVKVLNDEVEDVRVNGVEALVKIGKPAVEPLIKVWKDRGYNKYGRHKVAEALGRIGDARAIDPLIKALIEGYEEERNSAAEGLVKLGKLAVEPLIKVLTEEKEWYVCNKSTWALGEIGDVRAVEPLIKRLHYGLKAEEGSIAARALGKIGDVRAVEPLIRAMVDGDVHMHRVALEALVKIGKKDVNLLIKALGDKSWKVRFQAAWTLGEIGDVRAVEALIRALEEGVHYRAAWALGEIGDVRAVEPLIRALGKKDSELREEAIYALGKIGDARAVEPLIRTLGDTYQIHKAAIEALGRIGDTRAVEPLKRLLSQTPEFVEVGEERDWVLNREYSAIENAIKAIEAKVREEYEQKESARTAVRNDSAQVPTNGRTMDSGV